MDDYRKISLALVPDQINTNVNINREDRLKYLSVQQWFAHGSRVTLEICIRIQNLSGIHYKNTLIYRFAS